MNRPTRSRIFAAFIFLIVFTFALSACKVIPEETPSGTTIKFAQAKTLSDPTWIAIYQAMEKAISAHDEVPAYVIFRIAIDEVKFSSDGNLAVVWTSLVDKHTGEVQPSEPGLVIAHKAADGSWTVVLQIDKTFVDELKAIPADIMSEEEKAQFAPAVQQQTKGTVYRGYKLPWPAGLTKRLSGSIGHVLTYKSCPSTCLYAFDFADGTMFPISAAKAGTVKYAEWRYENGNTTNTNYIVLEDTTTTPTTYQVYYHLAKDSIPVALRTKGAKVYQGQFIGNADDTGASTGNHLHFHVHTSATSVWGTSVDIVFDEVKINGGRPRTCAEAEAYPDYGSQCMPGNLYTSQNGDGAVPTGGITAPADGSEVTTSAINVQGWMKDDVAVDHGQLMVTTDGTWNAIGAPVTGSTFSTSVDLCSANIPNGTVYLSLVVTDKAGKVSVDKTGLTKLTKNYKCPVAPPTCVPADNQAALYLTDDFQGDCQILDIGKYADLDKLNVVKSDQARSIKLGSGVSVSLYPDKDFGGNLEFLQASDESLGDNSIGALNASSAIVYAHIDPPTAPTLTLPVEASSSDELTLSWSGEDGVETSADLSGPNSYSSHLDWQDGTSWQIGALAAGDYSLSVYARNLAGTAQVTQAFSIAKAVEYPATTLEALPLVTNSTAVRLNWKVDSGADQIDHFEIQVKTNDGDWKTWSEDLKTDARTTTYTGSGDSMVHFRIRGVTAGGNAVDFADVAEVSTQLNGFCSDDAFEAGDPGDDDQATATSIEIGAEQEHSWCPVGDKDWLSFQATQGQTLTFTAKAVGLNSAAAIRLYNTDGSTLLSDQHPNDANSSTTLEWTVPADGTYYLRLSPQDSKIGGEDAKYTISVTTDNQVNPATLICGSITIPALLGTGFVVAKKRYDQKKRSKRVGWK